MVTDHESLSRIAETTICGQPTPALTDDALDGAGVILRGGEFGPSIYHIVLVFGPAGAQQALLRLQELSVPCEWMWTDELGLRSLWQAEPLALPPVVDDAVAWRVRFETRLPSRGTITGEFAYAYFVRGDLLAMVAWLPTDDNRGLHFIETLARQADQKLAEAIR